ncbi:hypothetical protein Ancab_038107 [Ancistrocladus abbreviatus]
MENKNSSDVKNTIIASFYAILFTYATVIMGKRRQGFVGRWVRESSVVDPRYVLHLDVDWDQISEVIEELPDRKEYKGIGLLNFNDSEIDSWQGVLPDLEHIVLHLDSVPNTITWDTLYPEWIDEEEEFEVPCCPYLPSIQKSGKWSRDVARFHLQLAAARLAASAKGSHGVHMLLVTDCFPIPNLFACKELVSRSGNAWLYNPNLNTLREKVNLPVGSCELSVPLNPKGFLQKKSTVVKVSMKSDVSPL